jgi:hypothetical protein
MEALNITFIILFGLLGLLALGCALFASAWWHYYTALACAILVLVSLADLRKEKVRRYGWTIEYANNGSIQ